MPKWEHRHRWGCLSVKDDRTCPVCRIEDAFCIAGAWEVCPRCEWEDDPDQRVDPNMRDSGNLRSLNEARHAWQRHVAQWEKRLSHRIDWDRQDIQKQE
ncbi:MAG TPA: CPCC family cysteine-rich protein [Armatimonadota bacterium]|nr:CPCC family cysteine-rich protein [Armatimonadota bacterium]